MSEAIEIVVIILATMIGAAVAVAILLMLVHLIFYIASEIKDQIEYMREDDNG